MSESFAAAFEETAPQLLQVAFDYVDQDPSVEVIWVVFTQEKSASVASTVYRIAGRVVAEWNVPSVLTQVTLEDQGRCQDGLSGLLWNFAALGEDEMPHRVVIRYDCVAERMDASFGWDEVLPEGAEITDGAAIRLWVERLVDCGDESADMTLTPEQMKL